uniref:Gypsy retrotransposon integrase-like protein 1 n=1 Tax=Fundulus heteroclitus TaxID=8078 RepID=A0A146PAI2_FUNHE
METDKYEELFNFITKGEFPEHCNKHQRHVITRRAGNFCVEDGQLFYIRHKGSARESKAKVACGASEAEAIFREMHAGETGVHCGQIKSREAISGRFYWPSMTNDISKWVSECTVCQRNKAETKAGTDYKPVEIKRPFELIGLDLISGLVRTSQGNQHICVLLDYCTRWAQAYPIKTNSAAEVTGCILKFIYQFEVPQRILADQGKEFVNDINTEVCRVLGIKKSLCVPYYPHTKRLVGRLKVTIQNTLTKVGYDKGSDWDLYLDAVMFGLRTKTHLATGVSPYYLMFGREARYPSQVPENFQVDGSIEECLLMEEVAIDVQRQEEALKAVQKHQEKAQQRQRSQAQPQSSQVGDMAGRKKK